MDLFCELQEQLLLDLRLRVRRGETTERQLARTTGVSQPHIHNILKGFRDLTPTTADRILRALNVSILDLIDTADLSRGLAERPLLVETAKEVTVLASRVGRGHRWPSRESRFERLSIAENSLFGMRKPVAFRLAPDPAMTAAFAGRELAVVDLGKPAPLHEPDSCFLIAHDGEARIRFVRLGRCRIYMPTSANLNRPAAWDWLNMEGNPLEKLVLAKVRFVKSRPLSAVRRQPPGMFRGPGLHFLAS